MVATKNMKKKMLIALACVFSFASVAIAQNDEVKSDISKSPEIQEIKGSYKVPNGQESIPVNYEGQPPLIPHSTNFYQVSIKQNDCLKCHDAAEDQKTEAKKMSPSHYNKDGKPQADRYVCVSCHVEQTDAAPIVDNSY